jgi:hypothetical protein
VLVVHEEESNLVHHDVSIVAASCDRIVRVGGIPLILRVRGRLPRKGEGGAATPERVKAGRPPPKE